MMSGAGIVFENFFKWIKHNLLINQLRLGHLLCKLDQIWSKIRFYNALEVVLEYARGWPAWEADAQGVVVVATNGILLGVIDYLHHHFIASFSFQEI